MEFKTMSSSRTILMTRDTLHTALWMFRRRRGAQDAIPLADPTATPVSDCDFLK